MIAAHKSESPVVAGLNANFKTLCVNSTPETKLLAILIAQFAIAGHVVHKGRDGDFTACKYVMVRYCKDFAELQAFAKQVGVK